MKNIMVSSRKHQGPIYSVLKRWGIGSPDKYGRGLWISRRDIPEIRSGFEKYGVTYGSKTLWVEGSNQHNHVSLVEVLALFEGE